MRIGVFCPTWIPLSARSYIDNVVSNLEKQNVNYLLFNENEPIPKFVDVYWDPRAMGGDYPYRKLVNAGKPLVVTVHGASPFTLSANEHFSNIKSKLASRIFKLKCRYYWKILRDQCDAFITVSKYGKLEIIQHLHLDEDKITPIWHGVDQDTFQPCVTENLAPPYFLHISQYQPKKNVNRILDAYAKLPLTNKPSLVAVVPNYPKLASVPEGVELIRTQQSHLELARLYAGAVAFIFPSLHESFGMPLVEAMASGCPVITSNSSACPEIVGDAALLVDPRSVDDIASAMSILTNNMSLRRELIIKGLEHAQQFTWQRSTEEHLNIFEHVVHESTAYG